MVVSRIHWELGDAILTSPYLNNGNPFLMSLAFLFLLTFQLTPCHFFSHGSLMYVRKEEKRKEEEDEEEEWEMKEK